MAYRSGHYRRAHIRRNPNGGYSYVRGTYVSGYDYDKNGDLKNYEDKIDPFTWACIFIILVGLIWFLITMINTTGKSILTFFLIIGLIFVIAFLLFTINKVFGGWKKDSESSDDVKSLTEWKCPMCGKLNANYICICCCGCVKNQAD